MYYVLFTMGKSDKIFELLYIRTICHLDRYLNNILKSSPSNGRWELSMSEPLIFFFFLRKLNLTIFMNHHWLISLIGKGWQFDFRDVMSCLPSLPRRVRLTCSWSKAHLNAVLQVHWNRIALHEIMVSLLVTSFTTIHNRIGPFLVLKNAALYCSQLSLFCLSSPEMLLGALEKAV